MVSNTSHRYNLLPLLRFRPGGVQRELVVCAHRAQRYTFLNYRTNNMPLKASFKSNTSLHRLLVWIVRVQVF